MHGEDLSGSAGFDLEDIMSLELDKAFALVLNLRISWNGPCLVRLSTLL
jgi:hypothetical protein